MYCPVTDENDLVDIACSGHGHRLPKLIGKPDCTTEKRTSAQRTMGIHELSRTQQLCLPNVGTRRQYKSAIFGEAIRAVICNDLFSLEMWTLTELAPEVEQGLFLSSLTNLSFQPF